MPVAKCRICGKNLIPSEAYLVVSLDKNGNKKKAYFCNAEEYEADRARKEKTAADKDRVYRLICDILGRKEIINTILWKEWVIWNKVASNEKIANYLEENKEYLTSVVARLENIEFKQIKYLSAILKNKLGDYKPKAREAEKPVVQVETNMNDMMYEIRNTNKNKRVSLEDLEDMF